MSSELVLYTAGTVFPIASPPITDGGVVVESGTIVAVGEAAVLATEYPHAKRRAFGDAALLPGLVNAHTHLEFTTIGATVRAAGAVDFVGWIKEVILARQGVTPADYAEAVARGLKMLLAAGVTTVGDILSPNTQTAEAARAYADAPLRAIAYCEVLDSRPDMAQKCLTTARNAVMQFHDVFAGAQRLRVGLSPHAPYTVSDELGDAVTRWAEQEDVPLQMHAAESPAERAFFESSTGPIADELYPLAGWEELIPAPQHITPIEYLARRRYRHPRMTCIHGVEVTHGDIAAIADAGAAVVHCPRSNRALGCGTAPLAEYLRAGVRVGLGTDSLASVPSLSIWDEMRAALDMHAETDITAADVLRLGTLGGAKALGLADVTGSLEAGKAADFIVINSPAPTPDEKILIKHTYERDVRAVFINSAEVRGRDAA